MALTKISTGGVKDDTADEAKLKVSNAGSNGQFLQKQSGNTGGLTWATVAVPDSDKIEEGQASVECDATGGSDHVEVKTANTQRILVQTSGVVNVGGAGGDLNSVNFSVKGSSVTSNVGKVAIGSSYSNMPNADNLGLGQILFGHGTTTSGPIIEGASAGGWSTNNLPSQLKFYTVPGSSTTQTERLRISKDGALGIGGANYGTSGHVLTSGGGSAAPSWAAIPPAGNTIDLVADGAIAAGKPVIIKSNGKAEQVGEQLNAISPITNNSGSYWIGSFNNGKYYDICYDEANEGVWTIYTVGNASDRIDVAFNKIRTGTFNDFIDSSSGNYQETTVDSSTSCSAPQIEYDPDTQRAVAIWIDNNNLRAAVLKYDSSNNSITVGSETTVFTGGAYQPTMCYDTANNRMVVGAVRTSSGNHFRAYVGEVTGGSTNSISFGSLSHNQGVTGTTENRFPTLVYDPDNEKIILYTRCDGGSWSNDGVICVGTVSGGSLTWNGAHNMGSNHGPGTIVYDPNVNKFLLWFPNIGDSNNRYTKVVTVSGTSVSAGNTTAQSNTGRGTSGTGNQSMTYCPVTNKIVFFYFTENGYDLKFTSGTISGTGITIDSPINIDTNNIYRSTDFPGFAGTYTKNGQHLIIHRQSNNNDRVYIRNVRTASVTTNATATNVIGFAPSAISDGNTGTINTSGNTVENQSGLTAGTRYYVKGDGTLVTSGYASTAGGVAVSSSKIIIRTTSETA
tara:strand:+ start:462 stop:2663 length:2202 start_codon:yes stop_codon:yes gene_type:complete